MKRHTAALLGLFFVSCTALATASSASATTKLSNRLAAMTPEHFAERTQVVEDPTSGLITLSTATASKHEGPSKWFFVEDGHARVTMDRRQKTKRFQVWHELSHGGRIGRVSEIRYKIGEVEHRASPANVEEWIGYCGPGDWEPGCREFTRFSFDLPYDHVTMLTKSPPMEPRTPWIFEVRDAKGRSATVGFSFAELKGLYIASEALRAE